MRDVNGHRRALAAALVLAGALLRQRALAAETAGAQMLDAERRPAGSLERDPAAVLLVLQIPGRKGSAGEHRRRGGEGDRP